MKKRAVSLLAAIVLALSLWPVIASAEDPNPFAAHDAEYEALIEAVVSHRPLTSAMSADGADSAEGPRTMAGFPKSMALTDIAALLEPYEYELIGRSGERMFVIYAPVEDVKEAVGMYAEFVEADRRLALPSANEGQAGSAAVDEQWAIAALRLEEAWEITTGSDDVLVAVIDSGLQREHECFEGAAVLNGYDYVEERAMVDSDPSGHGTGVASVIAASPDNGGGMAGVCEDVTILPLRTLDANGSGYASDAVEAIYMAVDSGADVINMSLGAEDPYGPEQRAVEYAASKGCIVVSAAGNRGTSDYDYPASYENVISVASVDEDLERAYFSQYNDMVDAAAPGSEVLVALADGGYGLDSGTSFSAPYISGIAALARSLDDSIDHDGFMELIGEYSIDLGTAGRDDYCGWGLPDVPSLLEAAAGSSQPTPTPTGEPVATPTADPELSGWVKREGLWYYYDGGKPLTGAQQLVGYQRGSRQGINDYFFSEDGTLYTGFRKIDGKWYFYGENGSDPRKSILGQMIKSYYIEAPGQGYRTAAEKEQGKVFRYYFDSTGAMLTGWYNSDLSFDRTGIWRYFVESGSSPMTSRLGRGCRYGMISAAFCIGNNGESHSYFFSRTGGMMTGEKMIHGERVFFNTEGGDPRTTLYGALIAG